MNSSTINVEILTENRGSGLSYKVNNWLNEHNVEIVDIKFQVALSETYECHSAMIIYKKWVLLSKILH